MDSDRVLVLDAGKVVEFDEPYELLQNESGLFTNMVKMTGKSTANNLKEMARLAHEVRENDQLAFNRAQLRDLQGSFISSNASLSQDMIDIYEERNSGSEGTPDNGSLHNEQH